MKDRPKGDHMDQTQQQRIYDITRPHQKLLLLYAVRCLLTTVLFPIVFLRPYFKYRTLKYRFDDEGIAMSWGLLWRKEINLTYARIQDIHVSRGLIERWLDLATVQIQTASGSGSAEMSIVGLIEYEALRDFLYSKMRGARFGETDPVSIGEAQGTTSTTAQSGSDEAVALLTDIRDEIRALRRRQGGAE